MKLYNLYKDVIFEETGVKLELNEGGTPSLSDVQQALTNKHAVNLSYKDGAKRYGQVISIGKTSKGNDAVRIYQINGPNIRTKQGKEQRYKVFIINHITNWSETSMKLNLPPDELFKPTQDITLGLPNSSGDANIAKLTDKKGTITKNRTGWQSNIDTKQSNEPLARNRVTYNSTSQDYEDNTQKQQPNYPTNQDPEYTSNYNKRGNEKEQPNYKEYQYTDYPKVGDEVEDEETID